MSRSSRRSRHSSRQRSMYSTRPGASEYSGTPASTPARELRSRAGVLARELRSRAGVLAGVLVPG
jgi:hypothetical protein